MKEWPKDGKYARFPDIIEPLKRALKFAYNLKRINEEKDISWDGLDIGEHEQATCLSPTEQLTANNLKYSLEDQRLRCVTGDTRFGCKAWY